MSRHEHIWGHKIKPFLKLKQTICSFSSQEENFYPSRNLTLLHALLQYIYVLKKRSNQRAYNLAKCDFTHFFAASALIKLPQRFSFELKVGNEKEKILRSLPP